MVYHTTIKNDEGAMTPIRTIMRVFLRILCVLAFSSSVPIGLIRCARVRCRV